MSIDIPRFLSVSFAVSGVLLLVGTLLTNPLLSVLVVPFVGLSLFFHRHRTGRLEEDMWKRSRRATRGAARQSSRGRQWRSRREDARRSSDCGMTRSDALDVLGLSPPVKNSTIEEAYRNRVKEVHPDRGGNVDEFKQVQQAYEVLSETEA